MSDQPRPDLFIIGAPKSGTTSLYEYLASHPQVYMSPVKEPLYFCPDIQATDGTRRFRYPQDASRYLGLFADARNEKRLGEGSTRYLVSQEAPRLIREFQSAPFFIAMLRNPIDMVYALHNERLSQEHETEEDFESALAIDRKRDRRRYWRHLYYSKMLPRWWDAFGRDRVHVVIFDDFVADTPAVFKSLLEFIEVDTSFRPQSFEAHNASHRQRRVIRAILDSPPGNWVTHRALPAAIGDNRRARLANRFRHSRLNRRAAPRPPLSPALRDELQTELTPEVEQLSRMLDRDLLALWFTPLRRRSA